MSRRTEYLFDNRAEEAAQRFRGLQDLYNRVTFGHLDSLGIAKGWRCWDVGAGGPSVATWMAERVGPRATSSRPTSTRAGWSTRRGPTSRYEPTT